MAHLFSDNISQVHASVNHSFNWGISGLLGSSSFYGVYVLW